MQQGQVPCWPCAHSGQPPYFRGIVEPWQTPVSAHSCHALLCHLGCRRASQHEVCCCMTSCLECRSWSSRCERYGRQVPNTHSVVSSIPRGHGFSQPEWKRCSQGSLQDAGRHEAVPLPVYVSKHVRKNFQSPLCKWLACCLVGPLCSSQGLQDALL